jgi:ADP-heptose:LPS heptosyltransferase
MPNWLGDVVMSLPIVKAIIEERKDVRFILISKPSFVEYLKTLDFVNEVIEAKDVFQVMVWLSFGNFVQNTQNAILF